MNLLLGFPQVLAELAERRRHPIPPPTRTPTAMELDDDLLFTGPDGSVGTKAQDLAAHASGAVRFREHQPTELRVRRVGDDVAIVALRAQLAVEVGGRVVQGDYRYTRVWARNAAGTWRVVGGQVSAVSEDTPAA